MSNKIKYIDIKNHTYYFFDDIINIKNFDLNNIKIDEKSYKNILIYCTGYVAIMKKLKKYIMIELKFLKELMLIKQVHQKNVMFETIGIA